ncbi:MAG: thioredoxin-dependent thiol peroxidase [Anaerolineaceae bacterium]|jgi:peroxiredoxin Q/BCP|nr:thioredoxin-dependent thiol peroxidase [Anaerolineaceae bacterium]MDD4042040.1 thioredoxin-dependent thiol peroxidase [Anaerolineaceae bacterium]MDD4578544.1 thioredoxin-dependent thiol peroxidase [Anaerolineaceae bacterium]
MLKEGDLAPDFELPDQEEVTHKLSDYRGKKVVLYFYPKDDTPGCTKEACSFRDSFADFRKHGMVVLGVSKDSVKSHAKFQEKYSLPFPLLSDTDLAVVKAYEVWGEKKYMGKEFMGVLRTTYIIDEEGKIMKVYEKVKPQDHAQEILQDIL